MGRVENRRMEAEYEIAPGLSIGTMTFDDCCKLALEVFCEFFCD